MPRRATDIEYDEYDLGEAEVVAASPKAIKVEVAGGGALWVPRSVIHDNSDVYEGEKGETGRLIVKSWWADKQDWSDWITQSGMNDVSPRARVSTAAPRRNVLGGEKPREKDDFYATPDALALAICRALAASGAAPELVVEPSAGDGAFVRAARTTWPDAVIVAVEPGRTTSIPEATDVLRLRWEDPLFDLEDLISNTPRVLVLGNPPYEHAEEHVRVALARLAAATQTATAAPAQPGAQKLLAFLLPASFCASRGRYASLFSPRAAVPGRLKARLSLVERPSFTGDGQSMSTEYDVLVWKIGHAGPYAGAWLSWRTP